MKAIENKIASGCLKEVQGYVTRNEYQLKEVMKQADDLLIQMQMLEKIKPIKISKPRGPSIKDLTKV